MNVGQQDEHRWLERLVGEWTYEADASAGPGEPAARLTGSESVRSIGGVWVVSEGRSEVPGGGVATTMMTLGYDRTAKRFVGTFVGSMMAYLWVYAGTLAPDGTTLTLTTEGPGFTDMTQMARYRDTIELRGDDERVLTSTYLDDAGQWQQIMTSRYRRGR